jgi:hypothetical protein
MLLKIQIAVERDFKFLILPKLEEKGQLAINWASQIVKKGLNLNSCWDLWPASTHGIIIIKTPPLCQYFRFRKSIIMKFSTQSNQQIRQSSREKSPCYSKRGILSTYLKRSEHPETNHNITVHSWFLFKLSINNRKRLWAQNASCITRLPQIQFADRNSNR